MLRCSQYRAPLFALAFALILAQTASAQTTENVPRGRRVESPENPPAENQPQELLPPWSPIGQDDFNACPVPELPRLDEATNVPEIAPAKPEPGDERLPINLASALRLANARPLVIQAAQASEMTDVGRWNRRRRCGCPISTWATITSATTAAPSAPPAIQPLTTVINISWGAARRRSSH